MEINFYTLKDILGYTFLLYCILELSDNKMYQFACFYTLIRMINND